MGAVPEHDARLVLLVHARCSARLYRPGASRVGGASAPRAVADCACRRNYRAGGVVPAALPHPWPETWEPRLTRDQERSQRRTSKTVGSAKLQERNSQTQLRVPTVLHKIAAFRCLSVP